MLETVAKTNSEPAQFAPYAERLDLRPGERWFVAQSIPIVKTAPSSTLID